MFSKERRKAKKEKAQLQEQPGFQFGGNLWEGAPDRIPDQVWPDPIRAALSRARGEHYMASPFAAYATAQIVGLNLCLLEELTFLSERDGFCQPSQSYLAEKLNVNRFTISRHLHQLKDAGMIAIQRRYHRTEDSKVRSKTNVYKVLTVAKMALKAVGKLFTGWASQSADPPSSSTELRQTAPVQQSRNNNQSTDTPSARFSNKKSPWQLPNIWSEAFRRWDPRTLLTPSAPLSKEELENIRPRFRRFADLGRQE